MVGVEFEAELPNDVVLVPGRPIRRGDGIAGAHGARHRRLAIEEAGLDLETRTVPGAGDRGAPVLPKVVEYRAIHAVPPHGGQRAGHAAGAFVAVIHGVLLVDAGLGGRGIEDLAASDIGVALGVVKDGGTGRADLAGGVQAELLGQIEGDIDHRDLARVRPIENDGERDLPLASHP